MSESPDETAIRNQIEAWAKAVRDRDMPGILRHHAPDMVMFDVPPPLQLRGIDSAPVNNGTNGDGARGVLARFATSPFNEAILRRWETIAYGSGSSSRLPR